MSLILIDLAYLGTKGIFYAGVFLVKGTYNVIASVAGYDPIVDTPTEEQSVVGELKSLKDEIRSLKEELSNINHDTFVLVDETDKIRLEPMAVHDTSYEMDDTSDDKCTTL